MLNFFSMAQSITSPLKISIFRNIWIANMVSNIGTWMHEVGAGWLMATMSSDPLLVSLVQTALFLPSFFLILPAGAIADLVDRRKLLIFAIAWMLIIACFCAFFAFTALVTPRTLLTLTFCLGIGSAIYLPVMASIMPDIVPKEYLVNALTLNSISQNITRTIGPVIAGYLIALSGPWVVFSANALSFLIILFVIFSYKHKQPRSSLPSERFFGAIKNGFAYVKQTPEIKSILLIAGSFFLSLSSIFSFMPLIIRQEMGLGPESYGLVVTSMGLGAVITGIFLPKIRERYDPKSIASISFLIGLLCILSVNYTRIFPLLLASMALVGIAWISMISTMQVALQLALTSWIRARGLSMFYATFMGSMALGGIGWGLIANNSSITTALNIALTFGVFSLYIFRKRNLPQPLESFDSDTQEADHLSLLPHSSSEQVMINVEYMIKEEDATEFEKLMRDVRRLRLRNGAIAWGLYKDLEAEHRYVEHFIDESWVEHLRRHQRQSADRNDPLIKVNALHTKDEKPRVSHYLSRSAPRRIKKWRELID
jgi:MFS family permease